MRVAAAELEMDGPAGGVDAIQIANLGEARVGHGLIVGERGSLLVDEVADVAMHCPGFRIIYVLSPPLATVGLPINAPEPRRSLLFGHELAIRVDGIDLTGEAVAADVGVVREGGLLLVVVEADMLFFATFRSPYLHGRPPLVTVWAPMHTSKSTRCSGLGTLSPPRRRRRRRHNRPVLDDLAAELVNPGEFHEPHRFFQPVLPLTVRGTMMVNARARRELREST